jgi:hypothetical protein
VGHDPGESLPDAIRAFSLAYADQTLADHAALTAALANGGMG